MSHKLIRDAIETQLRALVGSTVPIAWENRNFVPKLNTAYLSARLLPGMTQNPTFGGVHKREIGIYRVNVVFPGNSNTAAASAWAETLRDGFKRGTTLASNGVTVRILRDPYLAPALESPEWYTVPCMIPYQADVFS